MKPNIVIADDHPAARAGMRVAMEMGEYRDAVEEASNVTELMAAIERFRPFAVVSDLSMDEAGAQDGIVMISHIRRRYPDVRVVVMTMAGSADLVEELVSLGVSGVVSKRDDISELIYAVRHHRGAMAYVSKSLLAEQQARRLYPRSRRLTRIEIDVLRQLSNDLSITEIAARRSRSVTTVSKQRASALKKLCITNRKQLHWYLDPLRGR